MLDKIEEDIIVYKGVLELKMMKEFVGYDVYGCKVKKVSLSFFLCKIKLIVLGVWFGMGIDYLIGLKYGMFVFF